MVQLRARGPDILVLSLKRYRRNQRHNIEKEGAETRKSRPQQKCLLQVYHFNPMFHSMASLADKFAPVPPIDTGSFAGWERQRLFEFSG